MNYQTFEANAIRAGRYNPDGVAGYQCVDLIKEYLLSEFEIGNIPVGSAKNYWLITPSQILEKFDKIATSDVRPGDIIPLRPVDIQPSHTDGHIGLATGQQTPTTVEILEQNGATGGGSGTGGDAIRKRFVPKTRVYGVLRPKTTASVSPNVSLVGRQIQLLPTDERTTFRAGTTNALGKIKVTDNSFVYTVRGIDPQFPNRVLINSASAGGDGVALALQYTNGQVIPGWKVL